MGGKRVSGPMEGGETSPTNEQMWEGHWSGVDRQETSLLFEGGSMRIVSTNGASEILSGCMELSQTRVS